MNVNAATATDIFVAYVRHLLVPAPWPGQVVLLDSVRMHRAAAMRAIIEGASCRLVLLPTLLPRLQRHRAGMEQADVSHTRRDRPHAGRAGGRTANVPVPDHRRRCPRLVGLASYPTGN